jgi:hypothetical protein
LLSVGRVTGGHVTGGHVTGGHVTGGHVTEFVMLSQWRHDLKFSEL